jgi:propanol-preferring alcohol dehydrogenase
LTQLPHGGRLGLYGFGSSAHLTAQIAIAEGAELYVATRSKEDRDLAEELGAVWVGTADAAPPQPLDGAILFAPAGELVLPALAALDRGGVLAVAGIHLSDIPTLRYADHLFQERVLRSVTANTRRDGEELLRLAARMDIHASTVGYSMEQAAEALADLAHDRFAGSAVLQVEG